MTRRFTAGYRLTAIGSTSPVMERVGSRRWQYQALAGSLITTVVAGSGLIAVGIGYQTIRGVGHRFIMAVGFTTTPLAGAGLRIMCGGPPGFPGDTQTITAAGRLCLPEQFSPPASGLGSMAIPSIIRMI